MKRILLILAVIALCTYSSRATYAATVSGNLKKWHPITIDFQGPTLAETGTNPNPFLDYRLQVTLTSPSNNTYNVPGFFDGDGKGSGTGNIWRIRFSPDEAGTWTYKASFRSGTNVAIDLDPNAGTPTAFNNQTGTFTVAPLDTNAPGFLKWGRLEYVGKHYLKFRDGSYFLKGGSGSPENFFGYEGFDNTIDQPGGKNDSKLGADGLHYYEAHASDWRLGDPNWTTENGNKTGKNIIGVFNYFGNKSLNSLYFIPMNLGGDGTDSYPFIGAEKNTYNKTHYDISKLYQWNIALNHAQNNGVQLELVLAETELENEQWFDDGALGIERKLYYRELVARFSYLLALKWTICEESDFSIVKLNDFARYIRNQDWARHPIAVHTRTDDFSDYDKLIPDSEHLFSITSIQYRPEFSSQHVENLRAQSNQAGFPWVIDMDENQPFDVGLTASNANELRKKNLYDIYFSGGNLDFYFGSHNLPEGDDRTVEDFSTRDDMWNYLWYARKFLLENTPFWEMNPSDQLVSGETTTSEFGGAEVFSKKSAIYIIYFPDASNTGSLDLSNDNASFSKRWYNPRTGNFEGNTTQITGGKQIVLGSPPNNPSEDWVLLVKTQDNSLTPTPTISITPTPIPSATNTPIPSITPIPDVANGTIFVEDFNRPDNSAVNNNWTEIENLQGTVEISNNKLVFADTSDLPNQPMITNIFENTSTGKIRIDFDFDWARTGNENTYNLHMQLGDSSLMNTTNPSQGTAINLVWTNYNGAHQHLVANTNAGQEGLTTLSGHNKVSIIANIDTNKYDILVNNIVVKSNLNFFELTKINSIRFYTNALNEQSFANRSFDNIHIYTYPDFNHDNVINILDATAMTNQLFTGDSIDINRDGTTNILDLIFVITHYII